LIVCPVRWTTVLVGATSSEGFLVAVASVAWRYCRKIWKDRRLSLVPGKIKIVPQFYSPVDLDLRIRDVNSTR